MAMLLCWMGEGLGSCRGLIDACECLYVAIGLRGLGTPGTYIFLPSDVELFMLLIFICKSRYGCG